jgi:Arrestin (or S-antigen), N-terminal domain
MGSTASLAIEIENNGSVSAGGKIRGKVLLDVRKVTSADFLIFCFYGHELVNVQWSEPEGGHSIARAEAVIFLSKIVSLHSFKGGSVEKGHFEFPFEVAIPEGLPGSQSYKEGRSFCKIEYFCAAKLHRPGTFKFDVQREVLMNDEPYEAFPVPLFIGPTSPKVYFMGLTSRGTITMGGNVSTSNACGGDTLRVNYAIQNNSTSKVKALEIQLVCFIKLNAENKFHFGGVVIFKERILHPMLNGTKPMKEIKEGSIDMTALRDQINEGEFGVNIPIPEDVLYTFIGKYSSITYELSLAIKTSFGSSNSTIKVPIIMHRRRADFAKQVPAVGQSFKKPEGWSAVTIPTAALILDEPAVARPANYDTTQGLILAINAINPWQEINTLKDWLAHSPLNVTLLTPHTIFQLFQCIKGDASFFAFCRTIGEAMNAPDSVNKCTCKHIAEAASAAPAPMKIPVCNAFLPYCTNKQNARDDFAVIKLSSDDMTTVMMSYK